MAVARRLASTNNGVEPSDLQAELNRDEKYEFGEIICQKTAADWAAAQLKDTTANCVIEYILQEKTSSEII